MLVLGDRAEKGAGEVGCATSSLRQRRTHRLLHRWRERVRGPRGRRAHIPGRSDQRLRAAADRRGPRCRVGGGMPSGRIRVLVERTRGTGTGRSFGPARTIRSAWAIRPSGDGEPSGGQRELHRDAIRRPPRGGMLERSARYRWRLPGDGHGEGPAEPADHVCFDEVQRLVRQGDDDERHGIGHCLRGVRAWYLITRSHVRVTSP